MVPAKGMGIPKNISIAVNSEPTMYDAIAFAGLLTSIAINIKTPTISNNMIMQSPVFIA